MTDDRLICRRQAMDLLARREHSRLELARKLEAKSFAATVVDDVLDELEHDELLSSARFAADFVQSRYARGQGPLRIRMELRERGVSAADRWLDDAGFDWPALARQTRIRRFGHDAPANLKEKARQVRFLEYRGFSQDQIRYALQADDE